ncbi:MAG TPA: cysteine--tRNA ligase, partial [Thermoanaerobaculia bacterium]|nr:cysteine--tRNA ligase [Thermoanaerobaculia bacterium]
FRIASDPDYGRLSGIDPEAVRRGERVASDEYEKEDVRDFVLWKGAKEGEPAWDSPWGPGRPGWHIECSAMAMKYLGETFDLHCGGVDNIFPHHENEIAQSEGATGVKYVRYWVHSEHLLVDGEKMSKSLGNQYTLDDLLARGARLRGVRYLMQSVHYRQKLNFTFPSLEAAGAALRRIDDFRFRLEHAREAAAGGPALAALTTAFEERFDAALADDLNVSGALGALFEWIREVNGAIDREALGAGDRERLLAALARADEVFGVFDASRWPERAEAGPAEAEVEELVAAREAARRGRDWAEADRLRDQLAALGVVVEDTPNGPRWKRR